jgi:tryptophan halogenase
MSEEEIEKRLASIKNVIDRSAEVMPTHEEYIAQHCRAPNMY